jgi:FdhD protein
VNPAVRIAAVRRVGRSGTSSSSDSDLVAVEEPLQLEIEHGAPGARQRLNAGVVLRTPGRDEDLAAGLLFAEGFIREAADIHQFETPAATHLRISLRAGLTLDERLARRVLVRTGACGLCGRDAIDDLAGLGAVVRPAGAPVSADLIRSLPRHLRDRQAVFNETGGLHAAASFSPDGALLSVAEDVGRHNAVDKLVGGALLAHSSGLLAHSSGFLAHSTGLLAHSTSLPSLPLLLVSGRAAFEIVHKAVMAGVTVLAAVGAPSSLAVETARAFDLTLVGFLRDDRFNIYSGFDRIV